jgi:hypothetical protein
MVHIGYTTHKSTGGRFTIGQLAPRGTRYQQEEPVEPPQPELVKYQQEEELAEPQPEEDAVHNQRDSNDQLDYTPMIQTQSHNLSEQLSSSACTMRSHR